MHLTPQEKNTYINQVTIPYFKASVSQNMPSTIYDNESRITITTDASAKLYGYLQGVDMLDASLIDITINMIKKYYNLQQETEINQQIIEVCQRTAQLQQIVMQEKRPVSFISFLPFYNKFESKLVCYYPIFHPNGEVIAIQEIISEFRLIQINNYLNNDKTNPDAGRIVEDTSSLPISLSSRQHEIVFLLCAGIAQSCAAEILGVTRGSLSKIVGQQLCPKFGVVGSSAKLLVLKAHEMGYGNCIPRSLCKPNIIILDQEVASKYFPSI